MLLRPRCTSRESIPSRGELCEGICAEGIGRAGPNGCVRMANPEVEEVFDFAPLGTEVTIAE